MSEPERLPPEQIVVKLITTIKEKVSTVQEIEFGYDEDNHLKWWAKARLNSGRVRTVEVESEHMLMGPVDALAELGRELGLSIRIRTPEIGQGS